MQQSSHRIAIYTTLLFALSATSPGAAAGDGLISVRSEHSVAITVDRLEAVLQAKGMTIFYRVNHAAGAAGVGLALPPTEVLIFGNPKIGTPLMQCAPSTAIDLPQKALVSEDKDGQVWISYNDPDYISGRHGASGCPEVTAKIKKALNMFVTQAAGSAAP